jgi:hypothetical protein
MPEGIKPGKNKLKAIKDAKPPMDIKTIRSFVGLCNFFRTNIKDFALIAAALFKLTRKDFHFSVSVINVNNFTMAVAPISDFLLYPRTALYLPSR